MKALLRSSILALLVFAGFAAFSPSTFAVLGAGPIPTPCMPGVHGATACSK